MLHENVEMLKLGFLSILVNFSVKSIFNLPNFSQYTKQQQKYQIVDFLFGRV